MRARNRHLSLSIIAGLGLLAGSSAAADWTPQPDDYRGRQVRQRDQSKIYASLSFGEGAYFRYRCDPACDVVAVAPADFELLLGYRLSRHWQLDLGAVWAFDFDTYSKPSSMVGLRPGVRLLLPGLFRRMWYLRAAVPMLFGVSGENDDTLVGFLLGVGLEIRFAAVGFFAEINFSPYFIEVDRGYYVVPAQGRLGMSLRF